MCGGRKQYLGYNRKHWVQQHNKLQAVYLSKVNVILIAYDLLIFRRVFASMRIRSKKRHPILLSMSNPTAIGRGLEGVKANAARISCIQSNRHFLTCRRSNVITTGLLVMLKNAVFLGASVSGLSLRVSLSTRACTQTSCSTLSMLSATKRATMVHHHVHHDGVCIFVWFVILS